jgi:translation initiation factor 2 beta subunit (eIF-2beta)/eIF-5
METKLLDMKPLDFYEFLLDNIFEQFENDEQFKKYSDEPKISKPNICYDFKIRRTVWSNFTKNSGELNRDINDIKSFIEKELTNISSINGNNELLIKGKYNSNMIMSIFKKYIKTFVQCTCCSSIRTEITRNTSSKLDILKCNKCRAERTIK